jgi:hypothetical protein
MANRTVYLNDDRDAWQGNLPKGSLAHILAIGLDWLRDHDTLDVSDLGAALNGGTHTVIEKDLVAAIAKDLVGIRHEQYNRAALAFAEAPGSQEARECVDLAVLDFARAAHQLTLIEEWGTSAAGLDSPPAAGAESA